jgi:DNA modification methylase
MASEPIFAGAGSTLAAANCVDYDSIGVEVNLEYVEIGREATSALERLR